jgi:Mce-associated membrane protein
VSKHSEDQTVEEETTVAPTDTKSESESESESESDETSTEESVDKTEVADEADQVDKADEPTETADETSESAEPEKPKRSIQWARVFAFGVLPAVALLLAMGAGYLKWMDNSVRNSETARVESVQAAKDSTIALLSYKPDTVEQQLNAARDRLTGDFRDSYTSLTHDVVIPGAKQKQISAVATVPAAASVSANPNHAVVLVFVNQTVIVGQDAPTDTASAVRVTMDKVGDRWLIAKFDPV